MAENLPEQQLAAGVLFEEGRETRIPVSCRNDQTAVQAARTGVALYDASAWGRLQVSGDDRIRYLHNQTTNDFYALQSGQGCLTVFVTSTGRTIDLTTAYVLEQEVLLLVSPNRRQRLMEWMDRYIFGADKVRLTDVTDTTAALTLIGPDSDRILEQLGGHDAMGQVEGTHHQVTLAEVSVRVAVGTGLALPGYTLLMERQDALSLWAALIDLGVVPMGDRAWEQLRIQQGRPMPDHELTEEFNPLEAGLWHPISFSKGCYIGQETIARLNTYQGVKQQLWGIQLNASVQPGSVVKVGDEKAGQITSVIETPDGVIALGYIRTKVGGAGLQVSVLSSPNATSETVGHVVEIPFATRALQ